MDFSIALSGMALGAAFGFVLQHGKFCLNTAFRNILYIKDYTLFRSYILALVIAVLGVHLLQLFDLLHFYNDGRSFPWLANILGGYLFGIGMVLAGGCAAGTWYRAGEGLVGSWMAALGFMIGASAAASGILSGPVHSIRSLTLLPGAELTVYGVLGMNKWIVIALVSALGLIFVFAGRKQYTASQAGYHWGLTGVLVGALIVLGLYLSELMSGAATGITFPEPSGALLRSVTAGARWDWGTYMMVGVPLGSLISARGLHEFSWRAPRANVMAQQLSGGVVMGAGGVLAGGCSVGHGLTGLAGLSMPSLLSMVCIVLGCWTMVYFLFMRNPSKTGP